ncbi:MAG: SRPBCC family protein [Novosphingobium sp.]
MIETVQKVPVRVGIEQVWVYVKDIRRWAQLVPGLQDCEIIDENNSRWVLKVGVGGLVRTVKVSVSVDQWDGPEQVLFSFKLEGDPVQGGGSYLATATSADAIGMTLSLRVEGSGPMAPMWEAMGGPLLPKFALAFAEQLAEGIEAEYAGAVPDGTRPQLADRPKQGPFALLIWLWRALFGRRRKV